MEPRHILFVSKTAKGGSAFSLYHLISGLDKSRYRPTVLFYSQSNSYISDKLAELGIDVTVLKIESEPTSSSRLVEPVQRRDIAQWLVSHMGEIAGQIYNSLKGFYEFARHGEVSRVRLIIRLIRENDIELVHINSGLWSGKAVILAARLTNTPCVCHMRMFFDLNYFDSIFVRWVDHFVYISTAIAGYFTAQGISPTKGTVIHNAVDLIAFSRPCEVSVVRKEFGWTESELVVGNIGRLDWWKGHEYFLEAVADLSQKFPHIRALIVGPPESSPKNQAYFQKLRELTLTLGLENKVVFTGFRSDVPCLMSAVDIIVLSSSEPEPFGRVVIEGMAAGKPVVATAAGGVLDIIEDGVTGLLVPPRNAGAMAEAIEWLVVNQDKAHHIGRAARQHVVQTFALHRHITAVQNVYDAVLNLTSEFSKQPSVTKRMI